MEKPAPFSLLPDLVGRSVLDLGCGYGENCREFFRRGVARVLGLDISENMLEVANRESWSESVRFLRMSMNDLAPLEGPFDLAVRSLAVHYIENFDNLLGSIYRMLNPNGTLIFSQEHPLATALKREPRWSRDGEGHILHDNLTDDSLAREETPLDRGWGRESSPLLFHDLQCPNPDGVCAGAGIGAGSGQGDHGAVSCV